jgi:hypothetical protein
MLLRLNVVMSVLLRGAAKIGCSSKGGGEKNGGGAGGDDGIDNGVIYID